MVIEECSLMFVQVLKNKLLFCFYRNLIKFIIGYKCISIKDCPAAFKSPGDLKIHSAFHGAEHPHPCPYCNYRLDFESF